MSILSNELTDLNKLSQSLGISLDELKAKMGEAKPDTGALVKEERYLRGKYDDALTVYIATEEAYIEATLAKQTAMRRWDSVADVMKKSGLKVEDLSKRVTEDVKARLATREAELKAAEANGAKKAEEAPKPVLRKAV